jgi:hypothetical protein
LLDVESGYGEKSLKRGFKPQRRSRPTTYMPDEVAE